MVNRLVSVGSDFTLPSVVKVGQVNLPDNLTPTAINGVIDARAVKRGELVANVKDYGAVGDGTTDDTATVQEAMDALGVAGGGTLFFPPGEYYLHNQVNLVSNIVITGSGATLRKKGGAARYVVFAGSSGTTKGYGAGPSNIVCYGLTFKGQFGPGGRGLGAFCLHHSENVLVYGCRFVETTQAGHRFDLQGCRRITIRDNVFEGFDTTDPTTYYNEDIQLDYSARGGLSFNEPSDACFDGLGCEDIMVTGNRWVGLTVGSTTYPAGNPIGSHGALEGMRHRRIWFTDNEVGPGLADVTTFMNGRIHFLAWNDVVIRGNRFDGGGKEIAAIRVYSATSALALADVASSSASNMTLTTHYGCENIRIEGNHFTGFSTSVASSVGVIHSAATTGNTLHKHITISGNTFRDNKNAGDPVPNDGQNLIFITNAESVTVARNDATLQRRLVNLTGVNGGLVSQNRAVASSNNVILLSGCSYVDVIGNNIEGSTGSPALIVGGGTLCRVHNNRILSTTTGIAGIRINAGTTLAVVSGNTTAGLGVTLLRGIEISGTTTGVAITNNISSSATTPVYLEAGSTASTNTGNITI